MSRTRHAILLIPFLAFGLFSGCAYTALANTQAEESGEATAEELAERIAFHNAFVTAIETVVESTSSPTPDDLDLRQRFIQSVADERWDDAALYLEYWHADFDDGDAQEAEVRLMLHLQQFEEARDRTWGLLSSFQEDQDRWVPLWYAAWMQDPTFWRPIPYDMLRGEHYERLTKLGGGSTVSLRVLDQNDEIIGMIKPHSELGQTYYRGEIAAYRLCEIMKCGFKVPRNFEVRFRLPEFLRAYGVRSLQNKSTGYARRFSDIIVFDDQEDGEPWIHATFKDWVPGYTTFPVEHVDGWIALLNGYIPIETLREMSLAEALAPMAAMERADIAGMLARNEEGTDALDFARQLSNLHVFDYLMNNWDRYSTLYFGVNCQWNHGQFVSIDNGASFQVRNDNGASAWSRTRLRVIRRFSKSTVTAIRAMDRERTRELLFPESAHHPEDEQRFESFWERRTDFLQWLDELIERRGEERILSLP